MDRLSGFETFVFGSGWHNLSSVNFTDYTYDNGSSFGLLAFDNIVVTAVPIPAAVWLFGSGLLGLVGICRRTKAD